MPLGAGSWLTAHPPYTPHTVFVALTSIPETIRRGRGGRVLMLSPLSSPQPSDLLRNAVYCCFRLGIVNAFGLERKI